jgi:phasin family protein
MMTKAKTTAAAETTAFSFFTPSYFGGDALKAGFEKSAEISGQVQEFSKDTMEAYVESAMVAGQGVQAIGTEIYAGARKSAADSLEAARAIAGLTSINQVIELQQTYAKKAFADYVAQMNRLNGLFSDLTKSSLAPLQGRADALAGLVQQTVVR